MYSSQGSSALLSGGQVWAHVAQPFGEKYFDVVVIGAGRMGAAFAWYLRQLAPQLSLLLVEECGIPNEEGASMLAAGIWSTLDIPPANHAEALWVRSQLTKHFQTTEHRVLRASPSGNPVRDWLAAENSSLRGLINLEKLSIIEEDGGLLYRPASLALSAATKATSLGANLILNTRAVPVNGGVILERLSINNTHQIIKHEKIQIRSGCTVIAAGAKSSALVENSLGIYSPHGSFYQQYPMVKLGSTSSSPVIRLADITLWPHLGGWILMMKPGSPDPHDYAPRGGYLTGVPTGIRREVLEGLLCYLDEMPALSSGALQLGQSFSEIPSALVCLPNADVNATPMWQELDSGVYLLLGGLQADTLGLGRAYSLAAKLAGKPHLPW